jgi:hypothetical protein
MAIPTHVLAGASPCVPPPSTFYTSKLPRRAPRASFHPQSTMSFQDIETGMRGQPSALPQSQEDAAFLGLQSSLSLQVFKINSNVQAILKLVDQLGTGKDSANLRKTLCVPPCAGRRPYGTADSVGYGSSRSHDMTETTRVMAKRGSEDLKKLAGQQANLVSVHDCLPCPRTDAFPSSSHTRRPRFKRHHTTCRCRCSHFSVHSRSAPSASGPSWRASRSLWKRNNNVL